MPNLTTGKKCSHNTHMVMNRHVDWCHLCGAIRLKRYLGNPAKPRISYSKWISPPARKREAVAYLITEKERTS